MPLLFALLACSGKDTDSADSGTTPAVAHTGPTGAAFAEPSCAPEDGPAVRIIVGLDGEGCGAEWASVSHVRLTLYGLTAPVPVGAHPFDVATGSAWYGLNGGPEEYGSAGTVTVTAWDGATVTGGYEVQLDGGDTIEGHFDGAWCDADPRCG